MEIYKDDDLLNNQSHQLIHICTQQYHYNFECTKSQTDNLTFNQMNCLSFLNRTGLENQSIFICIVPNHNRVISRHFTHRAGSKPNSSGFNFKETQHSHMSNSGKKKLLMSTSSLHTVQNAWYGTLEGHQKLLGGMDPLLFGRSAALSLPVFFFLIYHDSGRVVKLLQKLATCLNCINNHIPPYTHPDIQRANRRRNLARNCPDMQREDFIASIFQTNQIIEGLASLSTGSSVYISTNKKCLGAGHGHKILSR